MSLDLSAVYLLYRSELINRLARMVNCRDTAMDIVQESYLVLSRTAEDQEIAHPRGFLHRIATNLALDHLRHRKIVDSHAELEVQEEEAEHPSTEAEVSNAQWRTMLHQTIAELPPRCRDAFILHKIQGLSCREVGETLGISQSAVEKHIIRGVLVVAGERAKSLKVSGRFDIKDTDRALESLEQTLPIRLHRITPWLVVIG